MRSRTLAVSQSLFGDGRISNSALFSLACMGEEWDGAGVPVFLAVET